MMENQVKVLSLEERDNFITVVTGTQGVGKTYRTRQELRVYASTDNRIGRKAKPVLIFDVNDELKNEAKHGIRTIRYDVSDEKDNGIYIAQFQRPELRRIGPQKPNGSYMSTKEKKKTFMDICDKFRNGVVLFEDLNVYATETKDEEVTSTLVNVRHRGVDVFMHVQSLAAITTTMWRNARYIRMHFQLDDVHRYRDRITTFEMIKIAQYIVNDQYHSGNKRFFVYVDQQEMKIHGCTVDQYKNAVRKYVAKYGTTDLLTDDAGIFLPKK